MTDLFQVADHELDALEIDIVQNKIVRLRKSYQQRIIESSSSKSRTNCEAESKPEDGEMVSDSMIGQEDDGQKIGESQLVEHQIRSSSPLPVKDIPEDTLGDMEVGLPLLTMEDNEEGKIEADETTPNSSADKLKNDGNNEAGFMAEEATIDDIPTATTTTAIQVPFVAEKSPATLRWPKPGSKEVIRIIIDDDLDDDDDNILSGLNSGETSNLGSK
nr:nuclear-pore anchor [Tanacetum cinerariifolium]